MHIIGRTHYGAPNVPREIRRLRVAALEHCLTHGQPVIWRHRLHPDDEAIDYVLELHGVARQTIDVRKCPGCFDSHYGQSRNDCPACYGVGYASVATSTAPDPDDPDTLIDEWLIDDGQAISVVNDGSTTKAPLWRGFGPPVLTWVTQPDVATDKIRWDRNGAYVDTQTSRSMAPWYPTMGDGDLLMSVTLEGDGYTIASIDTRHQAKMVQPQTVRGSRPRGHSIGFMVGQTFEMALVPASDALSAVTADS